MFSDIFSNVWSIVLVVLFFGGSILVHELGHFWAARWRGLRVTRFSIGFGPKIFAWHGKDGVEYRLAWIPLGGYVALPQLADMEMIEGKDEAPAAPLPEITYTSRMIVFAAGAAMNVVFAFLLACIIWIKGLPTSEADASTRIGYVTQQIEVSDGSKVTSPAAKAGLQPGDTIRSIDGNPMKVWTDINMALVTGSAVTADGRPKATLLIEREGRTEEVTVYPQLAGAEKDRKVGILPGYELIVQAVAAGSLAETSGFKAGDRIASANGARVFSFQTWQETAENAAKLNATIPVLVRREGTEQVLQLAPALDAKTGHGLTFTLNITTTYPTPFRQLGDHFRQTFQILKSLISPTSNVGLGKVAGPVGIVTIFYHAASAGLIPLLAFTILVNISLAVFNVLPIPLLDGGHMLFATIGKLRGKPLPANFVNSAQGFFAILLILMVLYVGYRDVLRLQRDPIAPEKAQKSAPAEQPKPAAPDKQPDAPTPAK